MGNQWTQQLRSALPKEKAKIYRLSVPYMLSLDGSIFLWPQSSQDATTFWSKSSDHFTRWHGLIVHLKVANNKYPPSCPMSLTEVAKFRRRIEYLAIYRPRIHFLRPPFVTGFKDGKEPARFNMCCALSRSNTTSCFPGDACSYSFMAFVWNWQLFS